MFPKIHSNDVLSIWQHVCKTRLRVLGGIQSSLDAYRKLIPPTGFHLDFSHTASTVKQTDPVPEPVGGQGDNGRFLSVRSNLDHLVKSLRALEPIGDKDLDSRRSVLLETAQGNISLLNDMRDDAWSDFLLARILENSSLNAHPVHIRRSDGEYRAS